MVCKECANKSAKRMITVNSFWIEVADAAQRDLFLDELRKLCRKYATKKDAAKGKDDFFQFDYFFNFEWEEVG